MRRHLIVLILILIPTFSLMLKHGIYTMHDFHVFRLYEFGKCITAGEFPCRWTPDAGKGYGEPMFNFYGQFPYWGGQLFKSIGFSVIDSTKLLFISTMVLAAIGMYVLARKFWDPMGALAAAILYSYTPYRAVDIWVRGALNEAVTFVLFPFIFLHFDNLSVAWNKRSWLWLTLLFAALVTTHNLTVVMLAPFLALWWVFRMIQTRHFKSVVYLGSSALVATWLSAYYLLPLIVEGKYITLAVTGGYYDFRAHFATLTQLFISRYWGYGASLWGTDDRLSLSVGHLQWIVPAIAGVLLLLKKSKQRLLFGALTGLALFALFLTHGRSNPIWQLVPPMAYIQFPWRFLTIATFFSALVGGAVTLELSPKWRKVAVMAIALASIGVNITFFRPDIWRSVSDAEQFSGDLWAEQRSSALGDFWPTFGAELPIDFAPEEPQVLLETSEYQKIQYPIAYFPGWKAWDRDQPLEVFPEGKLGLLTLRAPYNAQISLKFTNTWPRTVGNSISLVSLIGLSLWYFRKQWPFWPSSH